MNTSATKIVEENFKGLSDFIKDPDTLLFYKNLIATCMDFHATQKIKKHLEIASQYAECEKVGEGYEIDKESITGINIVLL